MSSPRDGSVSASEFQMALEDLCSQLSSLASADHNRLLVEGQMTAQSVAGIAEHLAHAFPRLMQDLPQVDVDRIVAEMKSRRRERVSFYGDPLLAEVGSGAEIDANEASALALIEICDQVEEGVTQLGRIANSLELLVGGNQQKRI